MTAVSLSLGASAVLLKLQGKPALEGIGLLFQGALGSRWSLEDCLIKAIPIFLCSLGVAVAFRLQIWNIGAEGQFALGAVGATWAALHFANQPWYVILPLMAFLALACGGVWGLIPAILKLRLRANEIIVTLMLNYIAILFLDFLVYGRWKDPGSFGFPMTRTFSESAIIPRIGDTGVNWGIAVCIVCGLALWIFFTYTRRGYELKVSGESLRATRYAGLHYERMVFTVMFASGGLAGIAGFIEASATINRLQPSIMVGYGYTAIVVAWLAKLNPLTIGLASFLLAALRVGVENLQLELQVPAAFGGIMEGMILLTVLAGSIFKDFELRLRRQA